MIYHTGQALTHEAVQNVLFQLVRYVGRCHSHTQYIETDNCAQRPNKMKATMYTWHTLSCITIYSRVLSCKMLLLWTRGGWLL